MERTVQLIVVCTIKLSHLWHEHMSDINTTRGSTIHNTYKQLLYLSISLQPPWGVMPYFIRSQINSH